MPQINEYQSQVDAQGPVGGVTPNLEAVSLFGRGVAHVGAAVGEAADIVHRREAQAEQSQVFGQMAQARALWNSKLKERLNDGSLDTNKFDQEYADYVNKIGENLSTAEGKDFFNKSANRLGGTLMQNAIAGQAQIAGQTAYDDITKAANTYSSTLMEHPDQFKDVHDEVQTMIAGQDQLNPVQKRRLAEALLPKLAEGAVRGWAMQDPGKDDNGNSHENLATQMLKNGGFDDYLDTNEKTKLMAFAREQDHLRTLGDIQQETTKNRQLQAKGQDYMDQNANRILNGSYNLQEMNAAPLTIQQKEYIQAKVKAQVKGEVTTDPRRYNDVFGKIINGDYTSRDQIAAEYNKGGLSPDDADKLQRKIDMTPEGHILRQNIKQIDKEAQGLRFKFGGAFTQAGDEAYHNFQKELDAQAQQFVDTGKGTMRDFYSNQPTNSPTSPLNILNRYRLGAADQMRIGAQEMIQNQTGKQSGGVQYSTSPTKEIIPPPTIGPTPPSADSTPPAPKTQESGFFDRMNDNRGGGELDSVIKAVGLDSESIAKTAAENDVRRQKQFAGTQAILGSQRANPKDDAIQPGESLSDYLKRKNKR